MLPRWLDLVFRVIEITADDLRNMLGSSNSDRGYVKLSQ
jgi:hypothetical protein